MADQSPSDLEGMESTLQSLAVLIYDVYKYVGDVVEKCVAPDNEIALFLAEAVSSLPKIGPAAFDKLLNDSLQDQLLLLYASSITRTPLSLAEKLNTATQICEFEQFTCTSGQSSFTLTRQSHNGVDSVIQ